MGMNDQTEQWLESIKARRPELTIAADFALPFWRTASRYAGQPDGYCGDDGEIYLTWDGTKRYGETTFYDDGTIEVWYGHHKASGAPRLRCSRLEHYKASEAIPRWFLRRLKLIQIEREKNERD